MKKIMWAIVSKSNKKIYEILTTRNDARSEVRNGYSPEYTVVKVEVTCKILK